MADKNPVVLMSTSMGDIRIELDAVNAPITTKNFVDYVSAGHYDGLIFHRVIPGFMIQGGGMDAAMNEKIEQSADQKRSGQRTKKRYRHPRHGAHQRRRQRHVAVFHQRQE